MSRRQFVSRAVSIALVLTIVCANGDELSRRLGQERAEDTDVESLQTQTETHYLADRLWSSLHLQDFYEQFSVLHFCFNFDSSTELLELLRNTLPTDQLLVDNTTEAMKESTSDEICGNWDAMVPHVCQTAEDYILYFQFVLQFDDPEKIPDTTHCGSGDTTRTSGGCLPGFFKTEKGAHPCCKGFFCPQMMHCMIPCPVGANCPRAHSEVVPRNMLRGLDTSVQERICSPYGYQERRKFGCGGADKWDANPHNPFFPVGNNRGNIYCPSGHYCEDTVMDPKQCHRGSYCRPGSVTPERCPPMTVCKAGTKLPDDYFGLAFDGTIFIILAIVWQASRYYNWIMRRLTARERIRIRWGTHLVCDIVPQRTDNNSDSAFAKGPSTGTFSSSIHNTRTENETQLPAVWATLSQELRPFGDDEETPSPTISAQSRHTEEQAPIDDTITIDFYALALKVRSCGKLVVAGASGKFAASKLTVLMGPSGSGKTSLLSYLACQGDYTMTNGVILLNGAQTTLKKYRKVMGFVPQDDIVHPKLTVEENLCFSACYRLPRQTKREEFLGVVDRAIQLLGLIDVRNQLVGNEEFRGISGGQRKRVNIGLELVADPSVLFLDEPTSGLDSSSCRHVMNVLARIAHMGVTCAAVVHQPSNRVMKLFDDILLLARNGRTVYYGPQMRLKTYFLSLGYHFPIDENPADVYLDIITRPKPVPIAPELSLIETWEESEYHAMYITQPALDTDLGQTGRQSPQQFAPDETGFLNKLKNAVWLGLYLVLSPLCFAFDNCSKALTSLNKDGPVGEEYRPIGGEEQKEEELRPTPRFHTQFWLCFYRCMLERTRTALRIFIEYALYAVSGMILGILSDARSSGRLKFFVSDMNFNIVAIALMTTVGSLRTFTQNQLIFYRESRSGLNKLAYYCATALFGDVGSILKGLCYLSLYYSYAQPRALFVDMFLVTTATIYSCSGFGYLISKMLKPGPAQLAAAVFVLSNALLAVGRSSSFVSFIRNFLYHRWALEAYTISEAKRLFGVWSLERCGTLHLMNYDIRDFPLTIIALFLLGFVTRSLSFAIIVFGTRHKND